MSGPSPSDFVMPNRADQVCLSRAQLLLQYLLARGNDVAKAEPGPAPVARVGTVHR